MCGWLIFILFLITFARERRWKTPQNRQKFNSSSRHLTHPPSYFNEKRKENCVKTKTSSIIYLPFVEKSTPHTHNRISYSVLPSSIQPAIHSTIYPPPPHAWILLYIHSTYNIPYNHETNSNNSNNSSSNSSNNNMKLF